MASPRAARCWLLDGGADDQQKKKSRCDAAAAASSRELWVAVSLLRPSLRLPALANGPWMQARTCLLPATEKLSTHHECRRLAAGRPQPRSRPPAIAPGQGAGPARDMTLQLLAGVHTCPTSAQTHLLGHATRTGLSSPAGQGGGSGSHDGSHPDPSNSRAAAEPHRALQRKLITQPRAQEGPSRHLVLYVRRSVLC